MKLNNLNEQLLMEMDFDDLRKKYERAVAVLQNDIHTKINLDALKEFILTWRKFARVYTHKNKKISIITEKGTALIRYIEKRIADLKSTIYIETDVLQSLIDYLTDFKQEVAIHMKNEKLNYDKMV